MSEALAARPRSPAANAPQMVLHAGDHLFIDNDTNGINRQHRGLARIPRAREQAWIDILDRRARLCDELGIPFRFLLAPDKQTVYRHLLPDDFRHRPAAFLLGHPSAIPDVAPLLAEAAPHEDVYPRTDSHWSHRGAVRILPAILSAFGRTPGGHPPRWTTERRAGDLGVKTEPPMASDVPIAGFDDPAELVCDNGVPNNGRIRVFARRLRPPFSPPHPSLLLVFGDSFAYEPVHFLAQEFDVLVHVHAFSVDHDLVRRLRPDALLCEITERFVFRTPAPRDGAVLPVLWLEKILAGTTGLPPALVVAPTPGRHPERALDAVAAIGDAMRPYARFLLPADAPAARPPHHFDPRDHLAALDALLADPALDASIPTVHHLARSLLARLPKPAGDSLPPSSRLGLALAAFDPDARARLAAFDDAALAQAIRDIATPLRAPLLRVAIAAGRLRALVRAFARGGPAHRTRPGFPGVACDAFLLTLLRRHRHARSRRTVRALFARATGPGGILDGDPDPRSLEFLLDHLVAEGDHHAAAGLLSSFRDRFSGDAYPVQEVARIEAKLRPISVPSSPGCAPEPVEPATALATEPAHHESHRPMIDLDGRSIVIDDNRFIGAVDDGRLNKQGVGLIAWAAERAEPHAGRPPAAFLVRAGGRIVARLEPNADRRDIARKFGDHATRTGCNIQLPLDAVPAPLRLDFEVYAWDGDGTATRLPPFASARDLHRASLVTASDFFRVIQTPSTRLADELTIAHAALHAMTRFPDDFAVRAGALCIVGYRILDRKLDDPEIVARFDTEIARSLAERAPASMPAGLFLRWHTSMRLIAGYIAYQRGLLDEAKLHFRRIGDFAPDLHTWPQALTNILLGSYIDGFIAWEQGLVQEAITRWSGAQSILRFGACTAQFQNVYAYGELGNAVRVAQECHVGTLVAKAGGPLADPALGPVGRTVDPNLCPGPIGRLAAERPRGPKVAAA